MKYNIFLIIFLPSLLFSQKQHKYRRQLYIQDNTDYIGKGNFGIESTFIFENDYSSPDTFYLPNNDFTYGINSDFEILLGLNSFYNKDSGWGIQPIDFGVKYNILKEGIKIPQIDVIGKLQTENIGSKKLIISKTLPMLSIYATKNFTESFHSVLDAGLQLVDSSPNPTFTIDFYSEYKISKKQNINFEINDFSTDSRFVNLIFGVGASRDINETFAIEFNCGKYFKNINQNYYFSFGFNKTVK